MKQVLRFLGWYAAIPPLVECGVILTIILVQIWIFAEHTNVGSYLVAAMIIGGWIARKIKFGEGLKELGLIRMPYLIPPAVAYAIQVIFRHQISTFLHDSHGIKKITITAVVYLSWGIAQQLILNGVFVRCLKSAAVKKDHIPFLAGIIFGTCHLPNPVLVPATLFGGILASYVFLRMEKRNVYVIGIVHGLIGTALLYLLPLSLTHHFSVGSAFIRWKPR